MNNYWEEYQENVYILYQLSKCIEMTTNNDTLTKLYELKHYIIEEQEKIDDYMVTDNQKKGWK